MDLAEARRNASELSGGTSFDVIKDLVVRCLGDARATGTLLDFERPAAANSYRGCRPPAASRLSPGPTSSPGPRDFPRRSPGISAT